MTDRVTIVGENNPYPGGVDFALYPAPDGCSGHRLCCLVLGMRRMDYLSAFARTNLVQGEWYMPLAREKAATMQGRLILLGRKVAEAFGYKAMAPFQLATEQRLLLPHPSGLCRQWAAPGAIQTARIMVAQLAPEVAHLLGKAVD